MLKRHEKIAEVVNLVGVSTYQHKKVNYWIAILSEFPES